MHSLFPSPRPANYKTSLTAQDIALILCFTHYAQSTLTKYEELPVTHPSRSTGFTLVVYSFQHVSGASHPDIKHSLNDLRRSRGERKGFRLEKDLDPEDIRLELFMVRYVEEQLASRVLLTNLPAASWQWTQVPSRSVLGPSLDCPWARTGRVAVSKRTLRRMGVMVPVRMTTWNRQAGSGGWIVHSVGPFTSCPGTTRTCLFCLRRMQPFQ